MSTRQAILSELLGRVGRITIGNGFATDAGQKVFVGETPVLGPDDPETAIALVVGNDTQPDEFLGDDILTRLPIEVQAIARADLDQPWLTVEAVIADVKHAIETADRTLGGLLARNLLRGTTRTLPREPGATAIGAAVQYAAIYLETWGA